MAITNWKYPQTVSGSGWLNADYIKSYGGNENIAQINVDDNDKSWVYTPGLVGTNFGFTSSDLPIGCTPVGIEIGILRCYTNGGMPTYDGDVLLQLNGVTKSSQLLSGEGWPLYPGIEVYYGGSTSLCGWNDVTRANILDSTFGLYFTGRGAPHGMNVYGFAVNYYRIRIYYSTQHSALAKSNNWDNVLDAKIADAGQMKDVQSAYVVVNGVWQKWWPPPNS